MTWRYTVLSKSHFPGNLFAINNTFMDELLAFAYTFMDEHSNPKMHKHEENTKETRNFAYFSSNQRIESSGENSPLIYEKSVG